MIAYLQGTVLEKLTRSIILKVDKIGYEITISSPIFKKIQKNEILELFIYTHVREDALSLFGFAKIEELKFFKQLIDVPGIGPKLGMDLLTLPIDKIKAAIINRDLTLLKSIPGVGGKIAERLVVEMKNKVELGEKLDFYEPTSEKENEEVMNALINLGYKRSHIQDILKKRPSNLKKSEDIIRYFLQNV